MSEKFASVTKKTIIKQTKIVQNYRFVFWIVIFDEVIVIVNICMNYRWKTYE